MQSIPQLIELFKHFQSSAFIFFTQIEPLVLTDSIPDSLSNKINNTDFLNLVQDCQNSLQRLDDYINVLHPLMAKEIKKLLKSEMKSSQSNIALIFLLKVFVLFVELPMNTSMTTMVVDNTCAKSVEIHLLLRPLRLMKPAFTALTVAVSFQNTMTAKAMSFMFALVKNVNITRIKRSFTRKVVTKSLKLQANSIDSIIITVISSLI